jgi:hypothetical protein
MVGERDQRAPGREAGDERTGAVDRIEHPGEAAAPGRAVLLAVDAVVGIALGDQRAHRRLGVAVGGGDRVEAAGSLVVDGIDGAEPRPDHRTGYVGEAVGEAEQFVQVRLAQRRIGGHGFPLRGVFGRLG